MEAAGPAHRPELINEISEMFPDACPNYIERICANKLYSINTVVQIIDDILKSPNYPKKQRTGMESGTPKLPKPPTQRQIVTDQILSYTSKFDIENFLKVIPDPDIYFNDANRKPSINMKLANNHASFQYATQFLKNTYNYLPQDTITLEFRKNNYNVISTANALNKMAKNVKRHVGTVRKVIHHLKIIENIPLLQEIAYIKHRKEITNFIKAKNQREQKEYDHAKRNGLIRKCQCCFDDLMPKDTVTCENNCAFCKECVRESVEISFAEGKANFNCLENCNSYFHLKTLEAIISPKLFSKLLQQKQLEEVQAACVEDFAQCPFCNFVILMDPNNKVFQCLNAKCMKETCRLCKELSHIPFRCDEIENKDEVKARVYMEKKMTEALIRTCYKCGMKFIKAADGCNKMTCSCGAKMCYICKKPVSDYSHFNGPQGTAFDKCPLFSDTITLHKDAVLKEAREATTEIIAKGGPKKLKHDPSIDIEEHYNMMLKQYD